MGSQGHTEGKDRQGLQQIAIDVGTCSTWLSLLKGWQWQGVAADSSVGIGFQWVSFCLQNSFFVYFFFLLGTLHKLVANDLVQSSFIIHC